MDNIISDMRESFTKGMPGNIATSFKVISFELRGSYLYLKLILDKEPTSADWEMAHSLYGEVVGDFAHDYDPYTKDAVILVFSKDSEENQPYEHIVFKKGKGAGTEWH